MRPNADALDASELSFRRPSSNRLPATPIRTVRHELSISSASWNGANFLIWRGADFQEWRLGAKEPEEGWALAWRLARSLCWRVMPTLGESLLYRVRRGETRCVPHATAADLAGFEVEPNLCHQNVDRWCELHPGDKPVRGWIISGEYVFDRHSVVDRSRSGLLDITPMRDRDHTQFLRHEESEGEFHGLPNQIPVVPGPGSSPGSSGESL